ncbi:hypothetical protein ABPG75_000137 [Micractinium tetrahymenae]
MDGLQRISASVRQHQDQEASDLERAALERVHAKRLASKEAVLVHKPDGGWQLVRLRKLDGPSRQLLLSRVYRENEDEGLGFFARVRERLDRAGVPDRTVEIRFRNLRVRGTQVVKSKTDPGLLGRLKALGSGQPTRRRSWNIIDGVSGVLKPGRLTLLLGTPGSGRSVLMKALAGRLGHEKTLNVSADELAYNGQSLDTVVPQRTAAYISQLDSHYGELTVRQTLDFAARVQGGRRDLLEVLEERERELGIVPDPDIHSYMAALAASGKKSLAVDIMLRTLGLDMVADTLVGNHMVRGISGGQKKRVTSGEMLVGPSRVLFADEISTGLDSATTHDIVKALRTVARYTRDTQLVALLQPPPETLELFDDVMVLSSGKIIFHGPRELVLSFFEGLGFACPERKGVAEFLQEVSTLADQRRYWARDPSSYQFISAEEISEAFYSGTEAGRAVAAELAQPFPAAKGAGEDPALVKTRYGASLAQLTRACLRRGLWLLGGTKEMHIGRLVQTILMAFVVGTLFLQEDKGLQQGTDGQPDVPASISSANYFLGVILFTVFNFGVSAFPDSAMLVQALPVWYKHRDSHFYPAFCFALQAVVMRLPWMFAESWVWTLMVYFLVGFVTSARLLAFWAICFAMALFALTLFLACASLMRKIPTANALQATFVILFFCTCGFIISKEQIWGGYIGLYWSNPLAYFMNGLAVNEFTSSDWAAQVEVAPGQTTSIGELALTSRAFQTSYTYVWLAIFVWGLGSSVINFLATVFFLTHLEAPKDAVIVSEEAYAMQSFARSGTSTADLAALGEEGSGKASIGRASNNKAPVSVKVLQLADLEGQTGSEGSTHGGRCAGQSALPFKPLCMTFQDVRYSVPFPKDAPRDESNTGEGEHAGQLVLLKGITGSFRPGVLTALMGASGAGKTTLMDVLAGRKTGGVITGDIRVNGFPKEHRTFARVAGYVEQTDIHVPFTSVEEALQFSARLRLPSHISKDKAKTQCFVEEIMDLIELTPIKHAAVGLPGSGLSVEQRKRLTIAVELVANPSIVFMDEPTSGLDARGAGLVMRAVKATVSTGRTVVCTIHQPSLEIFEAFSELLLLKRGGEVIFNGPVGQDAAGLISYFSAIEGVPAIKPRINPANWMLEVTSPEAEKQTGLDFAQLYARSELAAAAAAMVEKHSTPPEGDAPLRLSELQVSSRWLQLRELLVRNTRELLRDFSYNGIRALITLVLAIVFATLFKGRGGTTEQYTDVLNISGAMYAASVFSSVLYCFMVQDSLVLRRSVYYREHTAGTYSVLPFWAAELLAEVPFVVANSMIYSIIVYFSVGFIADASKFFFFWLMVMLSMFALLSFGMSAVHITPGVEISNALSAFIFGLMQVIGGFMKPKPAIPKGWIWLYYMNPASYSLYGLTASQLGDVDSPTQVPGGGSVPVSEFVESYFGFKHSWIGYTALLLCVFIVVFRGIALLGLSKLNFQSR